MSDLITNFKCTKFRKTMCVKVEIQKASERKKKQSKKSQTSCRKSVKDRKNDVSDG